MKFPKEWYLNDEVLIKRKGTSAVFDHSVLGLHQIVPVSSASLVGLHRKEAIGGMLYLTNYRLLFRSHLLNRERGTFSVFLPSINSIRDTSFGVNRNITVHTDIFAFTYIVWGIPTFIRMIEAEMSDQKAPQYRTSLRKAMDQPRLDNSKSDFFTNMNRRLTNDVLARVNGGIEPF